MLVDTGGGLQDLVTASPDEASAVRGTFGDELWQLVTVPGTQRFDVPASAEARRRLAIDVQTLPGGAPILLTCKGLGARGRCRRFAKEAGIELLREYVAIPSLDRPTCYVEDSPSALR